MSRRRPLPRIKGRNGWWGGGSPLSETNVKRVGSEVVGSLFWLAVGVFFAVGGILLKPGTPRNPGPGFLPLIMATLLVCFSVMVLINAPERHPKAGQWKSQAVLVGSVFVYGWLLDSAGFLLSTFGLMCVLFVLMSGGKARWTRASLYAAATALVGWLVFSVALKVPFPRGRLVAIEGWLHGLLR